MGGAEEYCIKFFFFTYCYIISLGAEGGAMEGKMIEKIEVRGAPFESTPRPR